MQADFTPVFKKYEVLAAQANALFANVSGRFPDCVKCGPGCNDCCHALFDLSLVEAMYINRAFTVAYKYGPERSALLETASRVDRELTRIKREMFHAEKAGADPNEIFARAAALRMRCPLLNAEGRCALYEARPVTCRLYGIPLDIGGKSHVCGLSAFEKGKQYPAVQMRKIQAQLDGLSAEIGRLAGSKHKFDDVYVPLSMTLLTTYDDAYFGLGSQED